MAIMRHQGRVPSVHDIYYPVSALSIQLRAYAIAECSCAPDYIINGYGFPMQTISCTWR